MAKIIARTDALTIFRGEDGAGTYLCPREGKTPTMADHDALVVEVTARLKAISPEAFELATAFAAAATWRPAGYESYRTAVAAGTHPNCDSPIDD